METTTTKKSSWQSETERFLFIPEGEILGICASVCACTHTQTQSPLESLPDDLEDKKGSQMFYCPSNPCCDKILVLLCSCPPSCTPWTTKRALVDAVLQILTLQNQCLGLGKEAKKASKLLPCTFSPVINGYTRQSSEISALQAKPGLCRTCQL